VVALPDVASAEPFTGRYDIVTESKGGVVVSGYIEFVEAPVGTTTFKLQDDFITDFEIRASLEGHADLVIQFTTPLSWSNVQAFSDALGADVLYPVVPVTGTRSWGVANIPDIGGRPDFPDQLKLFTQYTAPTGGWYARWDRFASDSVTVLNSFEDNGGSPTWWLELRGATEPIPEPSTLVLLGLGGVGLFVARRRRTKAA